MECCELKYGETTVSLPLGGAKAEILEGGRGTPITDFSRAFSRAVEGESIGVKLREAIAKGDRVTIIISDITRMWMRQDIAVRLLTDYLRDEIGIPYEDMVILVALGTHRQQTERELIALATPEVYEKVKVVNHDCDAGDLVFIGTTSFGTRVRVNPLLIGRKVIVIGGTAHHLMSGFSGGRKSVLPGVSARDTIFQNHSHALAPDSPNSSPLIGMAMTQNNPINDDMNEAAALAEPAYGINIVVNSASQPIAYICGDFERAWRESCTAAHSAMGVRIDKKADAVIVGCGGYPKDINLYQAVKSLINAAQAVKDGGDVIFLAECREGGGADEFFGWIEPLRKGRLDEALRRDFTIAGYIFYAACEVIKRTKTRILSLADPADTRAMGMYPANSPDELMEGVSLDGKLVYIMPNGGGTVPIMR